MKKFWFSQKLLLFIFGLFLIGFGFYFRQQIQQTSLPENLSPSMTISPTKPKLEKTFRVTRVIDGDTIEVLADSTQIKVRYLGINAPETIHPEKPVECFGKEGTTKNRELVENKEVKLEKDISETDKYGRLLRYVWVDEIFVNDYLVRQGFAQAVSYPPDVKYQEQLGQAEAEARENHRGLWDKDACEAAPTPVSSQSGECLIKGNISSSGEKIYHLPGQRYYNKTVIDESRDERWFCTEEEALSAGWRKAKI